MTIVHQRPIILKFMLFALNAALIGVLCLSETVAQDSSTASQQRPWAWRSETHLLP